MIVTTDEKNIFELIDDARAGNTVRMIGIGTSMRPLLEDGRDFIYLIAVDGDTELKKNDVIFYKSHEGLYVLHRIITISDKGYYPNGDGNICLEPLLKRENIYLKATGFVRKGRYVSTDSILYRLYSTLWTRFRPFRQFSLRWYGRFCRVISALKLSAV